MAHPAAWDGLIPCHEFEAARIVWVEIPKAASTSIKIALANALRGGSFDDDAGLHDWMGYTYAASTAELHDWLVDRWRGWWRFTVVRHPLERFASLYREKIDPGGFGSLNAWVAANADSWWWDDLHAVPQMRILGRLDDYDCIGRVERLADVARELSQRAGQTIILGHHNQTDRHEPLTPATRKLLRRRYADDLAALGYGS